MKAIGRSITILVSMALALGAWSAAPAGALETAAGHGAPPEGLSEGDWAQIRALMMEGDVPNSQGAYLKASNTGAFDWFGWSVAVSGGTVVVGAKGEDSSATGVNGDQTNDLEENSGAAYVFTRSGATWSQQAYLKASNTGAGDNFGWSVAIDNDTIVVGAAYEDSNATGVNGPQDNNDDSTSGAAYVFTRSGTTWSQQAYLKASNSVCFKLRRSLCLQTLRRKLVPGSLLESLQYRGRRSFWLFGCH